MTTKLMTLSQEQKSLIWNTKIAPAKGTEFEANAFFEICEEYGLNPILGDITFQRFETKYGPRVSYLISRDAYRKYAMRQDDFYNMLSGVVKEGDHFELDAVAGVPIHKFGEKRGKILGAWSVVKSKSRGNTVTFADFAEYHSALSGKNGVWNSMPSAMIEKVAQSMSLRSAFPLGVAFASEDEVGANVDSIEPTSAPAEKPQNESSLQSELEVARMQKENKKEEKPKTKAKAAEKAVKEQKPVQEPKEQPAPVKEVIEQEPVKVETPAEVIVEEPKQEEVVEPQVTVDPVTPSNVFEFVKGELGKSGSGAKFLRLFYKMNGEEKEAYARDEKIEIFDEFNPGTQFTAQIETVNGFSFVTSAQAV